MSAVWYERVGPASEVLTVGEMGDRLPRAENLALDSVDIAGPS